MWTGDDTLLVVYALIAIATVRHIPARSGCR